MERALEDALRLEGVDFETDAMMMSDAHLESPGQEGVGGGGGGEIDMSVGMEFDHIREQDMMMETEAEEIELMHGGEMSFGEEYHIAGGDMPVLGGEEEVLSEVSNNTSGEADGGAQGPEGEDAPSTPLNELTLSSMLSAKARPMTHVTVTSQQPSERGRSAAVAGPREVAIAPKPSPVSIDRFAGRQLNIAPKPVTLLSSNKPTALMKKVTLSSMLQGSKTGTVIGQLGKQLVMVPAGSAAQPRLKLVQGSTPVHYIKTEPSDHQGQVRRVAAGGRPVLTKMVVQGVQGAAGGSGPAQTVLAKLVQTPGGGPARYYTIQQPAQLVGVSPTRPGGSGGSGPPVQLRVCSKPRAQQLFSLKTGAKLLPAPPSQGKKIVISATAGQSMVMRTSSASTPPSLVSTAPAPATPRQQALPARSGSSLLAPPVHSRTTQLHQINVPGKGVQYIRLVTAPAKATPAQPAAEPPRPASKTLLLTDAQGNLVQMSAEKVSQPPPLLMSAGATVGQAVPKPPLKPQQKLVRIAPVVPRPSQKPIVTLTSLQSRPTFRSAQSILAPISPPAPAPAPAPCPPGREDSERDLQALIAESIAPEESARRPQEATRDESDNDDYNVTEVPIEYDGQESSMDGEESGEATTDPYEGRRAPVTPARIPRGWSPEDAADVLAEMEPELLAQYASPKVESNGVDMGSRPRKACNCTKSQCLKLYCDCFANGEFCNRCNCNNCHNNLENEEQRQKAIRSCLERNPNAFRPKIGKAKTAQGPEPVRRHNKGCNCKRSGCLKNYCECYEAKIACTAICKCVGCRNVEDSVERSVRARDAGWPDALPALAALPSAYPAHPAYPAYRPCRPPALAKAKQPCSFMTTEVITAVCQCLLAAAGERPGEEAPRVRPVLEEFSRCLQDIIAASRQGVHSDPLLGHA